MWLLQGQWGQQQPTAALEVLLGLPPLNEMIETEAQAGMCTLKCSQQWKPKFTNFCHGTKSEDMQFEPIFQVGGWLDDTKTCMPQAVYGQVVPDICKWKNGFKLDMEGGLVRYTGGVRPIEALILGCMYRWGSKSFNLWLHTTVFQAEIYNIKACVMGNTEKGYTGRNICILSDS